MIKILKIITELRYPCKMLFLRKTRFLDPISLVLETFVFILVVSSVQCGNSRRSELDIVSSNSVKRDPRLTGRARGGLS